MKMIPHSPRVVNVPIFGHRHHKTTTPTTAQEEEQAKQDLPVSPAPPREDEFYAFAYPPIPSKENNNNNLVSPTSFDDSYAPALKSHHQAMGNRRRAHTEEAPTRHASTTHGLPLAPCLDALPDATQRADTQQFLAAMHAPLVAEPPITTPPAPVVAVPTPTLATAHHDHYSTVSSVSNTSWERYQKLRDRYGWVPPPEEQVPTPFVPPPLICFTTTTTRQAAPASEIPDWLVDATTATTTSPLAPPKRTAQRRHGRAQTLPCLAEIAAQAQQEEAPAMMKQPNDLHHPLLLTPVAEGKTATQPPRRNRHARILSSDQLPDLAAMNAAPANGSTTPPLLDATSITSAEDDDRVEGSSTSAWNDTDTTKTHFKMPTSFWDKCNLRKVGFLSGNNHRRSQSYDFKASPSACFS